MILSRGPAPSGSLALRVAAMMMHVMNIPFKVPGMHLQHRPGFDPYAIVTNTRVRDLLPPGNILVLAFRGVYLEDGAAVPYHA